MIERGSLRLHAKEPIAESCRLLLTLLAFFAHERLVPGVVLVVQDVIRLIFASEAESDFIRADKLIFFDELRR